MPRETLSTGTSFGESVVRHDTSTRGITLSQSYGQSLLDDPNTPPSAVQEPPDMWSWSHAALYAHYACIGVVNGLLTQALLPFCLYVAHGEPNTCATVSTFVNLPWGYKILYGMLADCVPIFGLHRKPYMIIGWSLTWAIALFFALLESIDLQLASSLFLIMTIAYLMADCAADAALVGLSTREPMDTRGSILSTAYCIRFVFNILSAAVIAFLYNGPPTCGDFDFGLSTQQLMWVVVVVVGFLMGLTLPFYCEDKPPQPVPKLSDRLVQLHKLLQQPAVYRLILALTLTTATALITNQAQTNANKEWFHIEPLQLGLSTCFQNIMLAVGTYAYKRYLLNYSWRKTYAFGILGMQAFNLLYLLTVYFPEFKNGWWYIFTQVDMEFAYAFTFVIGIIIVPEITLPGYEGIIYGAITTFSNQAQNITNAINNLLLSIWPSNADNAALAVCKLPDDTDHVSSQLSALPPNCAVSLPPPPPSTPLPAPLGPPPPAPDLPTCEVVQAHMLYLTLLSVGLACSSLAFLFLLPSQKAHVRELASRPRSPMAGVFMGLLLLVLVVVGTVFAVLPIVPSLACLRIAGGTGCSGSA